ncbi:MAG: hypothetical protein L0H23_10470 [Luteimonas sp.]|nr:hypothetical protein [Luteimonas sp.]
MPDAPAPTERFSDRVDHYASHRPGCPAALPAWLRRSRGIDARHVVADIAAGTGISTRMWLDAGPAEVAAEPDVAMLRWFGDGLRTMACFTHQQRFGFNGLRGRLLASSSGQPGHEAMMDALRALFERHAVDGQVDFDYDTRVFVGTLG